jgi:hypothetical protein
VKTRTAKRSAAQALYWASGKVAKIKTRQTYYKLVSFDPFTTEVAGRHWVSCRLSMKMMKWSMKLDWEHWDHWACIHEHCDPAPCAVCGGWVCGIDFGED